VNISFFLRRAALLVAIAIPGLVHAQGMAADGPPAGWVGPPPGWSGGLLLGIASAPEFEGSRVARRSPVIGGEISYRAEPLGTIAMGSRGLAWTFVQRPEATAGLGLNVDPGRVDNGDRKLSAMGYRPGSAALRGLGEIDATPVLSAQGSVSGFGLSLTGAVRHATGSHEGTQVDLGLALPIRLGAHAKLSIAPSLTWADRRYMQAFFGVTPAQSAASGYAAFDTDAGLKSQQLTLDLDMAFSRHWHVVATLQGKRLVRDAADSPITQKAMQASGMVAAMYQFQL
jgi:outer membrane scaffolding protein for murein synthesis (MipA/OmpV family)